MFTKLRFSNSDIERWLRQQNRRKKKGRRGTTKRQRDLLVQQLTMGAKVTLDPLSLNDLASLHKKDESVDHESKGGKGEGEEEEEVKAMEAIPNEEETGESFMIESDSDDMSLFQIVKRKALDISKPEKEKSEENLKKVSPQHQQKVNPYKLKRLDSGWERLKIYREKTVPEISSNTETSPRKEEAPLSLINEEEEPIPTSSNAEAEPFSSSISTIEKEEEVEEKANMKVFINVPRTQLTKTLKVAVDFTNYDPSNENKLMPKILGNMCTFEKPVKPLKKAPARKRLFSAQYSDHNLPEDLNFINEFNDNQNNAPPKKKRGRKPKSSVVAAVGNANYPVTPTSFDYNFNKSLTSSGSDHMVSTTNPNLGPQMILSSDQSFGDHQILSSRIPNNVTVLNPTSNFVFNSNGQLIQQTIPSITIPNMDFQSFPVPSINQPFPHYISTPSGVITALPLSYVSDTTDFNNFHIADVIRLGPVSKDRVNEILQDGVLDLSAKSSLRQNPQPAHLPFIGSNEKPQVDGMNGTRQAFNDICDLPMDLSKKTIEMNDVFIQQIIQDDLLNSAANHLENSLSQEGYKTEKVSYKAAWDMPSIENDDSQVRALRDLTKEQQNNHKVYKLPSEFSGEQYGIDFEVETSEDYFQKLFGSCMNTDDNTFNDTNNEASNHHNVFDLLSYSPESTLPTNAEASPLPTSSSSTDAIEKVTEESQGDLPNEASKKMEAAKTPKVGILSIENIKEPLIKTKSFCHNQNDANQKKDPISGNNAGYHTSSSVVENLVIRKNSDDGLECREAETSNNESSSRLKSLLQHLEIKPVCLMKSQPENSISGFYSPANENEEQAFGMDLSRKIETIKEGTPLEDSVGYENHPKKLSSTEKDQNFSYSLKDDDHPSDGNNDDPKSSDEKEDSQKEAPTANTVVEELNESELLDYDDVISLAASCLGFSSSDDEELEELQNKDNIFKKSLETSEPERLTENTKEISQPIKTSNDAFQIPSKPSIVVTIGQLKVKNHSATSTDGPNESQIPNISITSKRRISYASSTELPKENSSTNEPSFGKDPEPSLLPFEKPENLENIPKFEYSEIMQIFGVTCFPALVNLCMKPLGFCEESHLFKNLTQVQKSLNSLSDLQLIQAYNFVYNHSSLYWRYFQCFCSIYVRKKNRSRLFSMISDCERYYPCGENFYLLFRSLVRTGMTEVNACRHLLNRSINRSIEAMDSLMRIILESNWTLFISYIEKFLEIPYYKFHIQVLNEMAPMALMSNDITYAKVLFQCILKGYVEEINGIKHSPNLCQVIERIQYHNAQPNN